MLVVVHNSQVSVEKKNTTHHTLTLQTGDAITRNAPNRPGEVLACTPESIFHLYHLSSGVGRWALRRTLARATGAAAANRASVRVGVRRGARLEPGEHVVDELGRRAAGGVLEHAERGGLEEARPLEDLGER